MLYLVMGVSGVGKTTISIKLSSILDAIFLDADDFHSKANIIKMNDGISLTDEDRKPWLLKLNSELTKIIASNKSIVLACSALKDSYRESLLEGITKYLIIYLYAEKQIIEKRLGERKNHFFNPALLSHQIEILESPKKNFIRINANNHLKDVIREIVNQINSHK